MLKTDLPSVPRNYKGAAHRQSCIGDLLTVHPAKLVFRKDTAARQNLKRVFSGQSGSTYQFGTVYDPPGPGAGAGTGASKVLAEPTVQ